MNGRCETDPLDRAVDVCDNCYGEFCGTCLVTPRGRRNPVCTGCALALSGVRGHASTQTRGDRRTAKQRRAELRASADLAGTEQVFRFFDADAPQAAAMAPSSRRKRPRKRAATPEPAQASRATRRGAVSADPEAGTEPATGVPVSVEAPSAGIRTADKPTPTPAVARLEELRRQQDTGTETETGPEHGSGHAAAPVPDPDPSPDTPAGPVVVETAHETAHEPAPAGPERRRAADHQGDGPPADAPLTAPMIGEIRTIGGRRAEDQHPPEPAPLPSDLDDDEPVSLEEALGGIEQFDALQPARPRRGAPQNRGGTAPRPKADTDASGHWIPPLLRGMAPDAREASSNLPQRRRG